jgi:adenine-specific DNA-methyltransferase
MQNLQNDLIELLKHEDNLVVDGHLNKNKIIELALKVEPQLIKVLLKSETFKKHFFQEVENVLVFDKIQFQRFVNNKSFLPDSYTAFKNKIGLITNDDDLDNFISTSNDVVLAWPHKDCVLEGGQTKEDQKRNEVFWNETLAPDSVDRLLDAKAFTNFKKFDKDGEHKVTELKGDENLILKGNNLLALASLLKTHRGKIKLIYIDPPYNTGDDEFLYNDNFNHSTWLTFMTNRLKLANKLLSKEGFISIQINDVEYAYLKILLDEVFGMENFVSSICVKMSHLSGTKMAHKEKKIPKIKEHILIYSKDKNFVKINPYYIPIEWDEAFDRYKSFLIKNNYEETDCKNWEVITLNAAIDKFNINRTDKKKLNKFLIENSHLIFRTARNRSANYSEFNPNVFTKIIKNNGDINFVYKGEDVSFTSDKIRDFNGFKSPSSIVGDIWTDIGINNLSNEGEVSLRFGKKPEKLIQRLISILSDEDDIVLDYHLGSGTTTAVCHKMNRKYIGVEQMDYIESISLIRMKNVINGELSGISKDVNWQGGGSFLYAELMQYNQKYIDQIQEATTKDQIINIWNEMQDTAFLSYQFDAKTFNERLDAFKTAPLEDMKQYLVEVLDKNQLYVNYSEVADATFNVSEEDKKLNKQFYSKK